MIYIGKNTPSAGQALIQDGTSRWCHQHCFASAQENNTPHLFNPLHNVPTSAGRAQPSADICIYILLYLFAIATSPFGPERPKGEDSSPLPNTNAEAMAPPEVDDWGRPVCRGCGMPYLEEVLRTQLLTATSVTSQKPSTPIQWTGTRD